MIGANGSFPTTQGKPTRAAITREEQPRCDKIAGAKRRQLAPAIGNVALVPTAGRFKELPP